MKILIIKDKKASSMFEFTKNHLKMIKNACPKAVVNVVNNCSSDTEIIIPISSLEKVALKNAKSLKWIHITSAGADKLPGKVLNSAIIVTNSSGVHPIPIAEHVFAFILMFTRQIHKAHRVQIEQKEWQRLPELLPVSEVHGKTVTIVGLGRIGREIAQLAKAFDMKVIGLTKTKHDKEGNVDQLYVINDLDKLLKKSDFVVNCLPGTKETYHLFNFEKFSKMKPTAYFINIGRGKTVKENDLVKALKQNIIAGAGLDVFEEEPLPKTSELWTLENVIITPHYSGWTPYYMDRVVEIFCENLKAYLKGKPMPNLVDKKKGY